MSSVSGKKLLIIAIACGVLAALMGWAYLKAKESQYRNAYKPAAQVMVSVVVPKVDIGKAQTLSSENVAALQMPSEYLPSNAVLAQDWSRVENRMTVTPLQRGRPITWDAIDSAVASRLSENVELGKRLKTVQVNKINSFDGMLRPGDRIDLLGSFSAGDVGLQQQPNYSDEVVMTVLENVEILAAGREDATGKKYERHQDRNSVDGFNMSFTTLSLMLTPTQAARVEVAEKAGELVAVLRNPKDTSNAGLEQITVSSLLDPLPEETVDVVLDANGNLLGRIIGDNVVDANGKIIGRIIDGKAIGLDGKVLGRIVRGLAADDPLLRMHEIASVVRDAQGNVIGKIVDGKIVDRHGSVIGSYVDGKAVGLDGNELGRVEKDVALDANGQVIDMRSSQVQSASSAQTQERQVVRDANGKIIGFVDGEQIKDAAGNVIGHIKDGQAIGLDGKVMGTLSTALFDAYGNLIGETGEFVRGADGKIIGSIIDGKLVDADGKVLGTVKDGKVVDANGKVLGVVEQTLLGADGKPLADAAQVVRDADGNIIGSVVGDQIIDSQGRTVGRIKNGKAVDAQGNAIEGARLDVQQDVVQIVRDAQGNVIGTLRGDRVFDASGKLIGRLVDGKIVDENGNVLYRGVTVGLETPRDAANSKPKREAARMIQFIPGGTGSNGVIPVQTLRLE